MLKYLNMARKKISEWKAKTLLGETLQIPYRGISVDRSFDLSTIDDHARYVVKVDEGVKKRMKKGLVGINRTAQEVSEDIQKFAKEGYKHFLVEPFVPHERSSEKYISIERIREGLQILYSEKGGIDVEESQESIQKIILTEESKVSNLAEISKAFNLEEDIIDKLLELFGKYHFSFFEINPLVVENEKFYFLDIAAEVDSTGEFFIQEKGWTEEDFRAGTEQDATNEEKNIILLSQKSQASFNISVLNPNGSIFLLLSGGGASIVLADEVYNLGFGKQIANYGEYSGNPNAQEVYIYTKNILELLLKSSSAKKVLLIGGGVANFTNISTTFKGIIEALDEKKGDLLRQQVKVFVRRGGPHQQEGLALMEKFLKENKLYGFVGDQRITLPDVVNMAVENL